MIDVGLLINIGYPFGIAIYEICYSWRDLPDDVKAGEEDHIEYVDAAVREVLGDGEWLTAPLLHDGVWVGIYRQYRYYSYHVGPAKAPAVETPLDEE